MRPLVLLALIAILGGYVWYQQQRNYGLAPIVTPNGHHFQAMALPDDCSLRDGGCMKRYTYLSKGGDTTAIKTEAAELLPWVSLKLPHDGTDQALVLIALQPGFLKMGLPQQLTGLVYGRRNSSSTWEYLGYQDLTDRLRSAFR